MTPERYAEIRAQYARVGRFPSPAEADALELLDALADIWDDARNAGWHDSREANPYREEA